MLFYSNKYLYRFLKSRITVILLLLIFSSAGYAQNTPQKKDTLYSLPFGTLFFSAYKKPVQNTFMHINPPVYKIYVLKKGGELMHWPSYPLTTGQIIARNTEWQRRNNQTVGEQIASDIIKNRVNTLIYGRKTAPAAIPKF